MNKYMHLIDSRPAFYDGEQICFANDGTTTSELFVDSLKRIRKEKRMTIDFRTKCGFELIDDYSYLRVKVD